MDILGKSFPKKELFRVYKTLKYDSVPIELIGTAGFNKQLYPADFDFNSNIGKTKPKKAFEEFKKIFKNIKVENDLYFIEFKFQNKDGSKYKVYNLDDLDEQTFLDNFTSDISYCKIDLVIFFSGSFREVSSNYIFTKAPSRTKLKKELLLEAKEYYNNGDYLKSLKRLFGSAKYEQDKYNNLLIAITDFLNSYVGKVYQRYNLLKAIELFKEKYNSELDIKKAELALKNLGLEGADVSSVAKGYKELFEREALAFYSYYKLKPGKLKQI